ncbi:MAG TPA: LD-carboxypeptidase [Terriglobales bacterium]|nr:LD-carboxypeptidase [Terriglobales bacterium]
MARAHELLLPPALEPGDAIGIAAPAGAVNREEFERGVARLRELEFEPVYDESIFARDLYFAGSVQRRVDEFHELLRSPQVKAIVFARGGYGSNYLLPQLDLDLIARHPKILCGYSDLSTLLLYLHDRIGLVGFHGAMVAKDFAKLDGIHLDSFFAATSGRSAWNITRSDSPQLAPLREGEAEAKLYGGCLSLMVASLGTPYEIHTQDTILFLEDVGEYPYRIDRMLMQLKFACKLDKVRGIVFGEMAGCSPHAGAEYSLNDVIVRVLADVHVPIAIGLRSGHVAEQNITLPIGVRARLSVRNEVRLDLLESATVSRPQTSKAGQR